MTGFLGKVGMAVPAPAQHEEPGSREGCMGRALVYSCPVFSAQRAQLWLPVTLTVLGLGLQHDHGWEELVQ